MILIFQFHRCTVGYLLDWFAVGRKIWNVYHVAGGNVTVLKKNALGGLEFESYQHSIINCTLVCQS